MFDKGGQGYYMGETTYIGTGIPDVSPPYMQPFTWSYEGGGVWVTKYDIEGRTTFEKFKVSKAMDGIGPALYPQGDADRDFAAYLRLPDA